MQGRIIKSIAGFYYVYAEDGVIYECRPRGIFRKNKITPLTGDWVLISITDAKDLEGSIDEILPRTNSLIRPAVANVDQAVVFFARNDPSPDMTLVDRLLITMEHNNIATVIVFNKSDLERSGQIDLPAEIEGFEQAGYRVCEVCVRTGEGLEELKGLLKHHTSALAGPSGVGKSSFINSICPDAEVETGDISDRLKRGRHTTRFAQILVMDKDSFIVDTPGFTSFELYDIDADELSGMYPEFAEVSAECRFSGCSHTHEPGCGVIRAVSEGRISEYRYNRYKRFYADISRGGNKSRKY